MIYLDREYIRNDQHVLTSRCESEANISLEMVAVVCEEDFMEHCIEKSSKLQGHTKKRKASDEDGRLSIGRITLSRKRRASIFMDKIADYGSSMEEMLDLERTRVKRVIHQLLRGALRLS